MSRIRKITLRQFRNYQEASFSFPERGIIGITGLNGVGKTNLLDAVYYLCYTKSYFTASQQQCVRNGEEGFRVEGLLERGDTGHKETISCKWIQGKKEIAADGVIYDPVTDHIGKYAAVMIAPDDTVLINGSSADRRKWMDGILGQADKSYLHALAKYQQALIQRNAWLKQYGYKRSTEELIYYNRLLEQYGAFLAQQRNTFIHRLLPVIQQYYRDMSGAREHISLTYKSDFLASDPPAILEASLEEDLRLQRTTKGAHRDELLLEINSASLRHFGSQGQKKTTVFALKLAQFYYLKQIFHHAPILLLDDVFEKMDQQRLQVLLELVRQQGFEQVILTDTHKERVEKMFAGIHAEDIIDIQ